MGAEDEFIVNGDENDYRANGTPPVEDANNRTFLILASLLTGTLLLLSLVSVGFLLMNRAGDNAAQITAIETQNAVILATNAAVTMTIESQELAALAAEEQAAVDAVVGEEATGNDSALPGGLSADEATATADRLIIIAADPTLAAEATIAADPTLVAAITQAAGGATPALPNDSTATAEATVMAADETAEATAPTADDSTSSPLGTAEATAEAPAGNDSPTAEAVSTVTAIPATTSTPGETPDVTVVIIGVTMEPTVADGSATPETAATPVPGTGGEQPNAPAATSLPTSYPPLGPAAVTAVLAYPSAITVTPADTGGGGTGQQATPIGGVTETPVGGATPSLPGTPTATLPPTATHPPTATATTPPTTTATTPPTATATTLPTATASATVPPDASATATALPTATATQSPTVEVTAEVTADPGQPTTEPTATSTVAPTETGTAAPTVTGTVEATSTTAPTVTGTVVATSTTDPTVTGTVIATSTTAPAVTGTAAATTTATPTPPTTLPETGLADWGVALAGFALLVIVFGARRLRRI